MKLSELIAYRESLDKLSYQSTHGVEFLDLLQISMTTLHGCPVPLGSLANDLQNSFSAVSSTISDFEQKISNIKQFVSAEILSRSNHYFAKSYTNYESTEKEPLANILTRELRIDNQDEDQLRQRIRINSDWKHPGVLLRPSLSTFVDEMVDLDPLYLVDVHHDLLIPCIEAQNAAYRPRLRRIEASRNSSPHLAMLPKNQIGFIFAWNFFNYVPLEVQREYFKEIWEILKPGGRCLFTYNDCDRSLPVILAEHNFASFTPRWAVENTMITLGFEVTHVYQGNYHLNWMEIKKPGNLNSLRGGQALATIKNNPFTRDRMQELRDLAKVFSIEIPPGEIDYFQLESQIIQCTQHKQQQKIIEKQQQQLEEQLKTAEEMDRLRKEAVRLKLDRTDVIMEKYTLKELKQAIKKWRAENERPLT
jgi:SAM-dependent methyltransferase